MDPAGTPSASSYSRPTVAVLGGTGFIGSALSRFFADQGHNVVVVARRPPQQAAPGPVRTLDLSNAPASEIAALLREESVDAVVNAAGGMWGLTDEEMVAANVTLVDRVIEAVASSPRRPRLVQIGSVHEYGLVPIGTSLHEDSEARPAMFYGDLKLRCAQAVTRARDEGRIEGLTLRIGNVVGAGQPAVSLLGKVAAQLRQASLEDRSEVLNLGPLGSLRDFVGLDDTMRAIFAAATLPAIDAPVINIGRGVATSAREMVQLLIEVSGVPTQLNEAARDGAPETTWQQLNVDLAREVLAWSPGIELRDDLKDLWAHNDAGSASVRA